MNLLLANADYRQHVTDEGEQLQRGLEACGWTLAGFGYGYGCVDVPTLLARHNPARVFVQDKRDWWKGSPGCYDKRVSFERIDALAKSGCKVFAPVKDAGTVSDFQRKFLDEIGATAAVVYYHENSIIPLSPWLMSRPMIRTYHSLDADRVTLDMLMSERRRGLVSGAMNPNVYPLRTLAVREAGRLGLTVLNHPGYGNGGTATHGYLTTLCQFKVHVATASAYGFALRKIIESVACGCTPVTDLPLYDVLPEIDGALMRVPQRCPLDLLKHAVDMADRQWNLEERLEWSAKAREFYDWRAVGERLSDAMEEI